LIAAERIAIEPGRWAIPAGFETNFDEAIY